MRTRSSALFWLLAPASMALWLILVTPTRWLGLETSAIGTGLLLLTAWVGLWFSTRLPADRDATVPAGEVRQWVALAFTLAIAAILVANVEVIAAAESRTDLLGVGRTIVMLIIGWAIFSWILRQRAQARIQEDERDRAIQTRSDAGSHCALVVGIIGLAVLLGMSPAERLQWASPLVLAHLLIFVLVLANAVGCATAIQLYRRERA